MHYVRRGSGSPIVLIHGIGSRWEVFTPLIDELAQHHDVVAVDLPGFGASAMNPGFIATVDGYAAEVAALIGELGLERPHIVGNSMGGGVAIELGRLGVAGRVTAFSPVGFWGVAGRLWGQAIVTVMRVTAGRMRPLVNLAARTRLGRTLLFSLFFGQPGKCTPAQLELDIDGLVGAPGFRAARSGFARYNLRGHRRSPGRLPGIEVTIAWGTRDRILWHRTQSAAARRAMPQAHHVDLPRCGHLPFSDDPPLCADVVLTDQTV